MEGAKLEALAGGGSVPAAWLARIVLAAQVVVMETQVLRTKIVSTPFAVLALRLEAREAKATMGGVVPRVGLFKLG